LNKQNPKAKQLDLARRMAAMFTGTILGQGLLFIASLILLSKNPDFIGNVGTGYGLAMMLTMVCDWGGSTTQRQNANRMPNLALAKKYAALRIPVAVVVAIILLVIISNHLPNMEISFFLLGATPGIILFSVNTSGLLDVIDQHATHAYWQGLPAAALALSLLFLNEADSLVCGIIFSAGCLTMISIQSWLTFKNADLMRCSPNSQNPNTPPQLKELFIEGAYILTCNLPGQVLARAIPTIFAAEGLPKIAAIYNLIKQSQGLLNQAVSLLRRAEYVRATERVSKAFSIKNMFHSQGVSIVLGLFLGIITTVALALLSEHLNLPISAITIAFIQSSVWLTTSAYFFHLQLNNKNSHQAFFGLIVLAIFFTLYFLYSPESIVSIISLEIAASILSFMAVILGSRKIFSK
jgi:hypothetical protein